MNNQFFLFSIFFFSLLLFASAQQFPVAGNSYGIFYTSNLPSISGGTISLNSDNRVVLLNGGSSQSPGPNDWALFYLLGKRLSFDVDVSGASCGCNAALYLVGIGGQPGYCDANQVDGRWCAEMDIFEGNGRGIRVTPHCCCSGGCDGTQGDACLTSDVASPAACDRWGISYGFGGNYSPWGQFDQPNPYGPGAQYYINTQLPYRYDISFPVDASGNLASIAVTLSQSGRTTALNLNIPALYLNRMTGPLSRGMGLVFSLWQSSDMTWLDGGPAGCSAPEFCSLPLSSAISFSNLAISTAGGATAASTAATAAPPPSTTATSSTAPAQAGSIASLYSQSWSGDLTYYGALSGIGNCALYPFPSWTSQLTWGVAMNAQQYASNDQCQACGVCLRGTYLGTGAGANPPPSTFTGVVLDQCPECAVGSIDIAAPGDGRWQVSWKAVDCPVGSGTLQWEFQGSNPWYMKLGVRNSRIAVTKLEVQTTSGGAWVTATRTQDNFFVCSNCAYPMQFPMPVRVTGVNNQVLTDAVPYLQQSNLVYIQGSNGVQFSPFQP